MLNFKGWGRGGQSPWSTPWIRASEITDHWQDVKHDSSSLSSAFIYLFVYLFVYLFIYFYQLYIDANLKIDHVSVLSKYFIKYNLK